MHQHPDQGSTRYQAVTRNNIQRIPQFQKLPPELRLAVMTVAAVLPFRANRYVIDELIDWERVPQDPIFQLTFPQEKMLSPPDFAQVRSLVESGAPAAELRAVANNIRLQLNPHPAGQLEHNVPVLEGQRLKGMQHKYAETVLFFPGQGQTCHAYCTYCFRWAQFVGMDDLKFAATSADDLVAYLRRHSEVSDVLFTGGDPAVMKTSVMRRYLEPLLHADLPNLCNIRIGTKALAYWPQRFVSDPDADDLLRLFEEVIASGRHLAIMAHFSHPRELSTPLAQAAVRRLRNAGCEIRMQAPLVRHVNDEPSAWAELWRQGVQLGAIPYYMFVERDTGPKNYFEVPLARAHAIYRQAFRRVSGLSRTVRGPSMSATPGKVLINGVAEVHGEKVFVLSFLQGRNPDWVGRPFFARFDPAATWLRQLKPAFGQSRFFYQEPATASPPAIQQASRLAHSLERSDPPGRQEKPNARSLLSPPLIAGAETRRDREWSN